MAGEQKLQVGFRSLAADRPFFVTALRRNLESSPLSRSSGGVHNGVDERGERL